VITVPQIGPRHPQIVTVLIRPAPHFVAFLYCLRPRVTATRGDPVHQPCTQHPADDVTLSNSPPTCSPLLSSITHSLFHYRLKTHLFHKSFHHGLLAPTWTAIAFSDYAGPDLLCSTVFHFSYFYFYFASCGSLYRLPLRTRAIPKRFCSGDSLRKSAISSVCAFTFTFTFKLA